MSEISVGKGTKRGLQGQRGARIVAHFPSPHTSLNKQIPKNYNTLPSLDHNIGNSCKSPPSLKKKTPAAINPHPASKLILVDRYLPDEISADVGRGVLQLAELPAHTIDRPSDDGFQAFQVGAAVSRPGQFSIFDHTVGGFWGIAHRVICHVLASHCMGIAL